MKLKELVDSTVWNEDVEKMFFQKLKRSTDDYNRAQNILVKARNILQGKGKNKIKDALYLCDHIIHEFPEEKFNIARAIALKGEIYEDHLYDHHRAYGQYLLWSKIKNCTLGGYQFYCLRSAIRANNYACNDEILSWADKFLSLDIILPTLSNQYWLKITNALIYSKGKDFTNSQRLANDAKKIYNSVDNPFWQRMVGNKEENEKITLHSEDKRYLNLLCKNGYVE